jgi:ATP-dependent Zn protease
MIPDSDNLSVSRKSLIATIDVAFGGKVAE